MEKDRNHKETPERITHKRLYIYVYLIVGANSAKLKIWKNKILMGKKNAKQQKAKLHNWLSFTTVLINRQSICSDVARVILFLSFSPDLSVFPPCFSLALAPLVTLLEFPEPTGPQVLPRDEQAALVRHHAALTAGVVVVRAHQQVLPSRFNFGALAGHIFSAHPQELVSPANAMSALLIDRYDVDSEFPPFARLISF